jgi:hypothetical protein
VEVIVESNPAPLIAAYKVDADEVAAKFELTLYTNLEMRMVLLLETEVYH